MKSKIENLVFELFCGMLGGSIVFFLILCLRGYINDSTGSIAEWIGSIGGIISLLFVYVQIKEGREEYTAQYTSKIEIQAILTPGYDYDKDSGRYTLSDFKDLQIWAVNISDAKGSYRYVGLCKEKDFATLKEQAFYNQELILNDYNLYSHIPITNYASCHDYESIDERCVSNIHTIYGNRLVDFLFNVGEGKSGTGCDKNIVLIYVDSFGNPITLKLKLEFSGDELVRITNLGSMN